MPRESAHNKPLEVTFGEIVQQSAVQNREKSRGSHGHSNQAPIFKDKLFFIEVFEQEVNQIERVADQIMSRGGKVSKQLGKNVDYCIYQNGRQETLIRAKNQQEFQGVKVVSPKWLEACEQANRLLDDLSAYKVALPHAPMRDSHLASSSHSKSHKLSEVNVKKRKHPVESSEEEASLLDFKTTSKRKIKQGHQRGKQVEVPANAIEEDSNSDYDEDEINRIVKQVQDQRFFKREFEKDLKKFAKIQAELIAEEDEHMLPNHQKKPKRDIRYMTKGQLIDLYIDGEVELPEFIEHMTHRMKQKKGVKHSRKACKGNKRLTEMFKPSLNKLNNNNNVITIIDEDEGKLNKSAFVTLQDFLFDIDKQATPAKEDKNQTFIKQSQLNFEDKRQMPLNVLNFKPINLLKESQMHQQQQRVAKSSTFNPKHQQEGNKDIANDSNVKLLAFNASIRRAHSLNPSKSLYRSGSILCLNKENHPYNTQGVEERHASAFKLRKKKKEWEKILPHRQVPSRIAKLNVSYLEDQSNYGELCESRKKKKTLSTYLF